MCCRFLSFIQYSRLHLGNAPQDEFPTTQQPVAQAFGSNSGYTPVTPTSSTPASAVRPKQAFVPVDSSGLSAAASGSEGKKKKWEDLDAFYGETSSSESEGTASEEESDSDSEEIEEEAIEIPAQAAEAEEEEDSSGDSGEEDEVAEHQNNDSEEEARSEADYHGKISPPPQSSYPPAEDLDENRPQWG